MIGRRSPLLVAVLLCGALLAGCGSSGSSTTSGSTVTGKPVTTSTAAPSAPASAGTTSTSATTPTTIPSVAAGVAQYVEICKSIVQREPTVSATLKAKVEGICDKAAHGDLAGARTASKEVCAEVINASPLPAAAKEKALAGCKAK
jgi:hypothetical protein